MRYADGSEMMIGDEVTADGMTGFVVCDFDNRRFANGYEGWDIPKSDLTNGSTLSSGVLINTTEAGLIHYDAYTGDIQLVRAGSD